MTATEILEARESLVYGLSDKRLAEIITKCIVETELLRRSRWHR